LQPLSQNYLYDGNLVLIGRRDKAAGLLLKFWLLRGWLVIDDSKMLVSGNRQPRVEPSSWRPPPENAASGKFLDLSPGYDINKKTFSG
jgi:hypothetical protein